MAESLRQRLTNILLEKNIITRDQLKRAIETQRLKGGSISQTLVELGMVKEGELMLALSRELSIPPINLAKFMPDPNLVRLIPYSLAKHYQILPLSLMADTMTVAMVDPLNIFAIDDIKALTGYKISLVLTTHEEMSSAVEVFYSRTADNVVEGLLSKAANIEALKSGAEQAGSVEDILKLTGEAPIVKLTNFILYEAVKSKASDILIEPHEKDDRLRYRIDGVWRPQTPPPKNIHSAIISRIKVMSNLNIAEMRLPQDGRFKIKLKDREVDFRVSVLPSSFGEKIALRILDKQQAMLDIDKLGFEPNSLVEIKNAAKHPHGMILICGPTGSGKTTTLYSILKLIDSPAKNIITIEDPVEYQLMGINQVTIRPEVGLTFASSLRSILRQDPDIIMVGEIRDFETIDIAIKAALTGHLVLSTLHTTTATGALVRLLNMGVEPFLINSSVIMVGAQRLLRKLCNSCKEPYIVNDILGKQFDIAPGTKVFKPKGCKDCHESGYFGRVGLIETMTLNQKLRDLIISKSQESQIRQLARDMGMRTLRDNGLEKVLAGMTSLEEVARLTIGESP